MALGPTNATWRHLYEALTELATECAASCAFVVDEGNGLWCVGVPDRSATVFTHQENVLAERFYKAEIVPRMKAMQRGAKLQITKMEGADRYAAASFANLYVLALWFEAPFEPFTVHTRIREALPEIERLTLLLPPSGGPGTDAGAAKARA